MNSRFILFVLIGLILALLLVLWSYFIQGGSVSLVPDSDLLRGDVEDESPSSRQPVFQVNEEVASGNQPIDRELLDEEYAMAYEQEYSTPITFYGRVVDMAGVPVVGATANMRVAERPWVGSVVHVVNSDRDGLFSLVGVSGAALTVNVSKPGYHETAESAQRFVYGRRSVGGGGCT